MQKSTAKRYAKALYEIALTKTASPDVGLDNYLIYLSDFCKALELSKDLQIVLTNPAVNIKKRRQLVRVIAERYGWDKTFPNFICLLIDRNRLRLAPEILAAMKELADKRKGIVRIHITSARPLSQEQVSTIVASVPLPTDASVEIETVVDPQLIGGAVVRIGEKIYDASVKTQLEKVRRSILKTV